ncbi:hypothetical protein ERO13_D01G078600v2 [Gossypium hirsutum]|nr:hypothetical protein ERO13_D01G078600v2 [Gossypium hirsutum]KAG4161814.1 hypothetical protein ERO13_D01G078600v2 [Gossypium hirsutum]
MRAWFSGGSSGNEEERGKEGSSLLSDWNSYAASKEAEEGTTTVFGFDLESAARSANDTVTGTFNVVSKGVRDLPGNLQSATSSVPSGKAFIYFGLFLAAGVFFCFYCFYHVSSSHGAHAPKICNLLYPWMWLYHWIILCSQRPKESVGPHVIEREASFYIRIYWKYGGHHVCFHGAS